ncbi:MAG: hypothetical protein M1571_02485 [Firmicutes bacterium]|nr:hypothetical protein [Bacillota bacterium]
MAKKRKTRRNPVSHLDGIQELSLQFGGDYGFESKLQRRAAWYAHRTALIDLAVENIPGTRPAAFFEYEYPEAKDSPGEEWEFLLQNGLLLDGEMPGILAMWTRTLELTAEGLAYRPDALEARHRQAKLLGEPAQNALKRVMPAIRVAQKGVTHDEG